MSEPLGTNGRSQAVAWIYAPLIAIQFLTRIPVRGIPDWVYDDEAGGRGKALVFYPAVGIIVGAIGACALIAGRRLGLPDMASAILAVIATAFVTGAFHEDGVADTADGLGPHNRDDALRVMRDSRIGTFGAVAVWAILSLKATALSTLPAHSVLSAMIAAHTVARWSSLPLTAWLPYVQPSAGLGGQMAAAVKPWTVVAGSLVALAIVGTCLGVVHGVFTLGVVLATILLNGLFYKRRFGGITGDCLGATNQIVEVIVLFMR